MGSWSYLNATQSSSRLVNLCLRLAIPLRRELWVTIPPPLLLVEGGGQKKWFWARRSTVEVDSIWWRMKVISRGSVRLSLAQSGSVINSGSWQVRQSLYPVVNERGGMVVSSMIHNLIRWVGGGLNVPLPPESKREHSPRLVLRSVWGTVVTL